MTAERERKPPIWEVFSRQNPWILVTNWARKIQYSFPSFQLGQKRQDKRSRYGEGEGFSYKQAQIESPVSEEVQERRFQN